MRAAFIFSMTVLPQHVWADCSSPLIDSFLHLFNVSSIDDLPETLLQDVQQKCASGNCTVNLPGCGAQSVDDLECEVPVFDVGVKIGTDTVCDIACDDWPCKVACQGIDVGICWAGDFVLCKVGCLVGGIFDHHCLEQCEKTIVDPCKKVLIDDCSAGCEKTFASCKNGCEKELTLDITAYFEKLEHVVSSLAINNFGVDCHGNGLTKPLVFSANVSAGIEDLGMALKIHTKDVSIGTTTTISLEQLKVDLTLPVNGSVQCGIFKKKNHIDINIGDTSVDAFDLNFDVNNKAFSTIAAVICLDLPFCKNAIQDAIDDAIKLAIKEFVPAALAKMISPAIQAVVDLAECPGSIDEEVFVLA